MRDPTYTPRPTRRPDGRAVVRLSGRDFYLGQAGAWPKGRKTPPPSIQVEYEALLAQWLRNGRQMPQEDNVTTVSQLILAYDLWAEGHYQREGRENTHLGMIRDALQVVKDLFGNCPAREFGPKKLEAIQAAMAGKGWSRSYVNAQVARVRRMIKWAVRQEILPGNALHALQTVPGLTYGTPGVRETQPVEPVAEAVVEDTLPRLPPTVATMVRLQLLTGARPGEVCLLRACDIDMSGPVWVYTPLKHKTQHRGRRRVIPLGPQAQAIVRPYLKLSTEGFLFGPAEAEEARNARRREARKSPMTPSQARRQRVAHPRRPKREHYDETSYRNAVYRGCDRAFPLPEQLAPRKKKDGKLETRAEWWNRLTEKERQEVRAWRSEHRWHPNQLRHTRATQVRGRFGIDAAQAVLGHSSLNVTQVYAELDQQAAMRVAAEIG